MAQAQSNVELVPIGSLKPYRRNARTHSKHQVRQIAESIRKFGFTNPVLVSDDLEIVAGHGRILAAKELALAAVPVLRLSHLSAEDRRAYVIADNKLAQNAGWDFEILTEEFQALNEFGFDLSLTGFSPAEIDLTYQRAAESSVAGADNADLVPQPPTMTVTLPGDIWRLGRHRLLCGDARSTADIERLLCGETADLIATDPPYNVKIDGNAMGLGAVRHREFAMASGEMSEAEFTQFLTQTLGNASRHARDGAIAFVFMDWRHMREVLAAGSVCFSELKNLCVWNKTNGGMGSFYRSKHELVFVFKVGTAAHVNNFGLGDTGRYRTNVWDYAGISSPTARRAEELAMHPTVKPVAMIADAIKDCTHRGDVILDIFGGSGSTLIAAETCGRRARLLELDPGYCDTIITRWERYTGQSAFLDVQDASFAEIAEQRLGILLTPPPMDLPRKPARRRQKPD